MKVKIMLAAAAILGIFSAGSASGSENKNDRINVIFETDYGNDADDAIALDAILKYCDAGRMKLLGVSTHKGGDNICPAVDATLTWYGYGKVPLARSPRPVGSGDGNGYADSVALKRDASLSLKPTRAAMRTPSRSTAAPSPARRTAASWSSPWDSAPTSPCSLRAAPTNTPLSQGANSWRAR